MRKKLPGWISVAAIAIAVAGLYAQHSAPQDAGHGAPAPAAVSGEAAGSHGQPAAAAHGEPAAHGEQGSSHEKGGHGGHAGLEGWKWANFLLLAGGLGYLIKKNAGPFFSARSKQIQQEMAEAAEMRRDAEARAAEVERRLANLDAELAALRAEAAVQAETENTREAGKTAAEIARIHEQAEQEIASAGKAARLELRRYASELALGLAETKIRTRMSPEAQDALVRRFVRDLPGASPAAPPV